MKIFTSEQVRKIDADTISMEPVSSINLMERAAKACLDYLRPTLQTSDAVVVFCGTGNNGGDGLALTRLLKEAGYSCEAILVRFTDKLSRDAEINYSLLKTQFPTCVKEINNFESLQKLSIPKKCIVLDALLGTGLNTEVVGFLAEVIAFINKQNFARVVSIDVPSGLYSDKPSNSVSAIVVAQEVVTFQFPKLAFLIPENGKFAKSFNVLDIGLHPNAIAAQVTNHYYITKELVVSLLTLREKFSHKGSYGHVILFAGSKGKSGAALIAARACMRSGVGKFTLHSTKATIQALLQQLPEAMSSTDVHPDYITEVTRPENYDAIGFGPGVGLQEDTQRTLKKIIHYYSGRLVIDADGLNALADNKTWLSFLRPNTILTPHPKEFERLTKKYENDFEQLEGLKQFALKHQCVVVLKLAHTAIAMPDGTVFFNSSGNAGLAKAGSGDGLTGIILGLLGRGYSAPQAAIIGVFIHGYTADICVKGHSMESLLISDVIEKLPIAFFDLENYLK